MDYESFIGAFGDVPTNLAADGTLTVMRTEDFGAWYRRVRDAHEREVDDAVADAMTDADLAERIDAEVADMQAFCDRLREAAESREDVTLWGTDYIALPVDADGVPIHVGDVVTMQLLFGGESKPLVVDRMELSHGRDGDLWCVALDTDKECWNQPSLMRHYTPPTVEDVLREFAKGLGVPVADSYVAAAAAKLTLRGDE